MIKMKNTPSVLITGNRGYIGTVMTKFLKRHSYYVVGLDSGLFEKNCFFPVPDDCRADKQIFKDIRQISRDDLKGIDIVIHLAGLSNDPLGEINPSLTEEINFKSTVKIAKFAKETGVKRFIFASSCSIYGISQSDVALNEEGALNPITAYAKAKVDSEKHLSKLADTNFHPVFMRNATVYGLSPMLRLDLVVNNLLAWAYLKGEITIMSDGTPWRPIVHIEDLCQAFICAVKAHIEKIHLQAFNVGTNSDNYRVKDIADKIQRILPRSKIRILNKTGSDERTYRVDFSKIKDTLTDFKPLWNLEKGITDLFDAYKKHKLTKSDFDDGKYFRIKTVTSLIESGKMNDELLFK